MRLVKITAAGGRHDFLIRIDPKEIVAINMVSDGKGQENILLHIRGGGEILVPVHADFEQRAYALEEIERQLWPMGSPYR